MVINRSKNLFQFISRIIVIVLLLLLCFVLINGGTINYTALSIIILVLSIAEIVVLIFNDNVYSTGLTMIFFLYTLMVHNGFVIAYLFDKNYISFQSSLSMAFVHNMYYNKAIIISNIVIGAFVISTEIKKTNALKYRINSPVQQEVNDKGNIIANIVGLTGLIAGGIYLVYLVVSNGLWLAGYFSTLAALEDNSIYGFVVVITSLCISLLIVCGTKKGIRFGLIVYLVISILHFSMGNRGEVMYAAVVCFALYSIRFKSIKLKHVIIIGLVVVILIPLVRITRELRLDVITLNPFSSFLDVLCEEGIEISPFTYTVQCVEKQYGHAYGLTYLNDFLDFICRRFGIDSPLAVEKNIIKEIMPYSGMGYSMVAELYYNFGIVFASIIYVILAQIMKKIDMDIYFGYITERKKIFYSMLMVEMINLTRNDATTLPLYLTFTILIYLTYTILLSILKVRCQKTRHENSNLN